MPFILKRWKGVISTHFMNGFAVAISSFTPVRYNPYKGKLSYFEDVTVTIETAPDSKAIKALENINTSPAVLQRLALLVEIVKLPLIIQSAKFVTTTMTC